MKKLFIFVFFLIILITMPNAFAQTIQLFPTDDSYVVFDANDIEDKFGLRATNYGDKDHLFVASSWNTTKHNEKVMAISYLKFNLTDLPDRVYIEKAEIKMKSAPGHR